MTAPRDINNYADEHIYPHDVKLNLRVLYIVNVSHDLAFFKNDLLSTLIYLSAYVHIVLLECYHVSVSYAQKNTHITIAKRALLYLTAEENMKIW